MLAYLLPFFSVMMIALAAPLSSLNVFIWVLLIPLVSHLLLGRRLGLAQLGRDGDDLSSLTRCADQKLYSAKAAGRNRIKL